MTRRSRLHALAAFVLFAGTACDEYACQWTDEPIPEPVQTSQLERRYTTDDGRFAIVLHADGEWPPSEGTTALRIEVEPEDAAGQGAASLSVDPPYLLEDERVAAEAPSVAELRPGEWQVDDIVLDAKGVWAVPLVIEQGEIDDSIELYIEVVDDA
jgi:hypothetical protein